MVQTLVSDVILKELVKDASDVLADGQVTFSEIVYLGGKLASKVNQFQALDGKEKTQLVIKIVELALAKVLDEKTKNMTDDEKRCFSKKIKMTGQFAKETLPAVLDVAVSAARGKLDLKAAKKSCWSCLKFGILCAKAQGVELPIQEVEKKLEEIAPVVVAVKKTAEVVEEVAAVAVVVAPVVEGAASLVENAVETTQIALNDIQMTEVALEKPVEVLEKPEEEKPVEESPSNKEA